MALQRAHINWKRLGKRKRKKERQQRRMARAVRWNLYLAPVAAIIGGVLIKIVRRILGR